MKTTRKLTMAAIMVMVALLAFVGSTFAWMTVGNSVKVSEVSGTVQGAEGIYMRVRKSDNSTKNWSQVITLEFGDYTLVAGNESATQLKPLCMRPVSSGTTGVYNTAATEYNSSVFAALKNQAITDGVNHFGDASGGYIELKLDVYSEKTGIQIYALGCNISTNTAVGTTKAKDVAALACTRVLFSGSQNTTGYSHYNDKDKFGIVTPSVDYEANDFALQDTHTFAVGEFEKIKSFYDVNENSTQTFISAGVLNPNGSIKEKAFSEYKSFHDGLFKSEGASFLSAKPLTDVLNAQTAAPADDSGYETIIIRIYIEGWDSLCANYVAGGTLKVDFVFGTKVA